MSEPSRTVILGLQAAVRRTQRAGGTAEAIVAWVQEALASPAPRRGRRPGPVGQKCPTCPGRFYGPEGPCSKCRSKAVRHAQREERHRRRIRRAATVKAEPSTQSRGPDLAWRETIAYGSRELRMTDAAMARELGVTRERIRQIRNKTGIPIVRCACGSRAREGGQCGACKKKTTTDPLTPCRLDCGRRTRRPDGRCFLCYRKVRIKEDPEFKAKLYAIQKKSINRSPESIARYKANQKKAMAAYRARHRAARQATQSAALVDHWRPEAGR